MAISSFLLVIYFSNQKSLNAGLLTFLTNRLGDGFLLCAARLGFYLHSFRLVITNYVPDLLLLFILFVLGAFTKSAQVPFSSWLPAAIAAPTPVSALVHSSTLVTAGVYLLFRTSYLIPSRVATCMFFTGCFTILVARLRALREVDIKKIIALSTLSQLGLIVTALGLQQNFLAFFHLLTHAFF